MLRPAHQPVEDAGDRGHGGIQRRLARRGFRYPRRDVPGRLLADPRAVRRAVPEYTRPGVPAVLLGRVAGGAPGVREVPERLHHQRHAVADRAVPAAAELQPRVHRQPAHDAHARLPTPDGDHARRGPAGGEHQV